MGIGVVLIFYVVVLTVLASLGALALGGSAYLLTRKAKKWRRAVFAAALFPFLCEGFAGGWFIVYALVNYEVFKRDPMLGDTWQTPLPNGYALMMIDTTDQGTVYNPTTQSGEGLVMERKDAVFGVRQLQVSNEFILGARDSKYFSRIGEDSKSVDTYFEIDTAHNQQTSFKSLDELSQRAASRHISLQLRDFQSVFADYRSTWFDYSAFAILIVLPVIGFLFLAVWIWRTRRNPGEHAMCGPQLG